MAEYASIRRRFAVTATAAVITQAGHAPSSACRQLRGSKPQPAGVCKWRQRRMARTANSVTAGWRNHGRHREATCERHGAKLESEARNNKKTLENQNLVLDLLACNGIEKPLTRQRSRLRHTAT
jgi:hypothetical protein